MADGYRRLVRLVARLFYAEDVPPPEASLPDEVPAPRRAKQHQVPGVTIRPPLNANWLAAYAQFRPGGEGC